MGSLDRGITKMKTGLRAAMWLALAACWPAQADFIEKKKYQEVMDPPTPVRGHAVVGLSVKPSAQDLRSDVVSVRFDPDLPTQEIRLDVASANGRLRGDGLWEHTPTGPSKNWVVLAAPPRGSRPDQVDHVALAAQPATLNDSNVPTFQLAAWGRISDDPASVTIRVYVNTRRAELFVYGPGTPNGVRCQPVAGGPTVRFDAVCDMDLSLGKERSAQLTLVRRDGGQTSKQPVKLRW
jgi:hypothetical protein